MFGCRPTNQDALTTTTTAAAAALTTKTTTTTTTTTSHSVARVTSRTLLSPYDIAGCQDNPTTQELSLARNEIEITYSDSGYNTSATCPIITVSTDSESADIGESSFAAELPLPPADWLPMSHSSLSLANRSSDPLTLQSLEMNNNCLKADPSSNKQVLDDYSDLTDGRATSDDSLTGDLMRLAGTWIILATLTTTR